MSYASVGQEMPSSKAAKQSLVDDPSKHTMIASAMAQGIPVREDILVQEMIARGLVMPAGTQQAAVGGGNLAVYVGLGVAALAIGGAVFMKMSKAK